MMTGIRAIGCINKLAYPLDGTPLLVRHAILTPFVFIHECNTHTHDFSRNIDVISTTRRPQSQLEALIQHKVQEVERRSDGRSLETNREWLDDDSLDALPYEPCLNEYMSGECGYVSNIYMWYIEDL
jgi:hypothetical protein